MIWLLSCFANWVLVCDINWHDIDLDLHFTLHDQLSGIFIFVVQIQPELARVFVIKLDLLESGLFFGEPLVELLIEAHWLFG